MKRGDRHGDKEMDALQHSIEVNCKEFWDPCSAQLITWNFLKNNSAVFVKRGTEYRNS